MFEEASNFSRLQFSFAQIIDVVSQTDPDPEAEHWWVQQLFTLPPPV